MTNAKRAQLLAYSSRLAWAFKAGISLLLSAVFALLVWDAKGFCVFFLLFSAVGIITDIVLYFRRNSLFTWDIQDTDVPAEYEITAKELLSFARNIPKVRLCRLMTGMFLFPLLLFSSSFSIPMTFLASVLMNYYPAALADTFWAKRLGVKIPASIYSTPKMVDCHNYWQSEWLKHLLGYSTAFGRR